MKDGIPDSQVENAMEQIEKFNGRGTPNEWEEIGDFSEIEVERSNSIYRIHVEGQTIEYRTGRGESFTETLGDIVGDNPVTLDAAARQNYNYRDQNLKAWELEPLTDGEGYLLPHLSDDFERLYQEIVE
jgi:hypothetical protein